jgi:hypothetical protein
MNRYFIIILVFFSCNSFSQDYQKINKLINIPDSLTHVRELRIYKNHSISNCSEVFRIYHIKNNNWKIELYKFYDTVTPDETPAFTIEQLNSSINLNRLWLDVLETHVEFLPNISAIDYKLKFKTVYDSDTDDYGSTKKIAFTDGIGYIAFIKNYNKVNQFNFTNAESYLKYFPEVDELNSYSNLLNLIRDKFSIWK